MSKVDDDSWPYYALDLPGLSHDDAERILDLIKEQGSALGSLLSGPGVSPGTVVEPGSWYVRSWDRCAVRAMKTASEIALASGRLSDADTTILTSGVEDFTEWLEVIATDEDSCDED